MTVLLLFLLFICCVSCLPVPFVVEVFCDIRPCVLKRGGLIILKYYFTDFYLPAAAVPSYSFTLWKRSTTSTAWTYVSLLGWGLSVELGSAKYVVATVPDSIWDNEILFYFAVGASFDLMDDRTEPNPNNPLCNFGIDLAFSSKCVLLLFFKFVFF